MQLAKLKYVSAVRQRRTVTDVRRDKLVSKLDEQIGLASAQIEGRAFAAVRSRTKVDEAGQRVSETVPARVKQWWWKGNDGKLLFSIQYGAKALELAKGRNAIEVGSMPDLVEALKSVRAAAEAGELDGHIETASASLRAAFNRKPAKASARAA
jgi:uncharacterized protein DUF6641